MSDEITIRRATASNLPRVAALAAALVRMHHAVDPDRFFLPENVEDRYAWWLGRERQRAGAVVLVAARGEHIDGYAYGTVEERDWNLLLDAHGAIHDVFVVEDARRQRVGHRLLEAIIAELKRSAPSASCSRPWSATNPRSDSSRALAFAPTLLEMTR